jgi:hypothetical protein
MAQLDRLMREARKSMRGRGHTHLSSVKWDTKDKITNPNGRVGATIFCDDCMMEAQVIPKPQPNEIQIGGEAVTLSCDVATAKSSRPIAEQPLWRFEEPDYAIHAVQGC